MTELLGLRMDIKKLSYEIHVYVAIMGIKMEHFVCKCVLELSNLGIN